MRRENIGTATLNYSHAVPAWLFFYTPSFAIGSREADDGTVEYSGLYYRCSRILADLLYDGDASKRHLEFSKRYLVMNNVSRHVQPQADDDRRKLQKLPVFLYNSMPEISILEEFKDKVLRFWY